MILRYILKYLKGSQPKLQRETELDLINKTTLEYLQREQKMNTAGWTSNDPEQLKKAYSQLDKVKMAMKHCLEQQQQIQQAQLDAKAQIQQAKYSQLLSATNIANAWPATITGGIVTFTQPGCYIYDVTSIVTEPPPSDLNKKDFYSKLKALAKAEPHKVAPRVPDRIEPIVAYRAWKSQGTVLGSVGTGHSWTIGEALKARCTPYSGNSYSRPMHPAPVLNCDCGIWAFKTQDYLEKAISGYLDGTDLVVGQVYLWGRLIECERGYRAEFAYPKEIWCLRDEHKKLGMAYNVPVRIL